MKHVYFTKYRSYRIQFVYNYLSGITKICMTSSGLNAGNQERRVAAADEDTGADAIT